MDGNRTKIPKKYSLFQEDTSIPENRFSGILVLLAASVFFEIRARIG